MKKATLVVDRNFLQNRIFDGKDTKLNRDNCLAPFIALKQEMAVHGIELCTQDIHDITISEIVIYNDMPSSLPKKEDIKKSYVLIMESPIIVKSSWDIKKHQCFNKIFTWKDSVVDGKKYFKINYTYRFPTEFNWPAKRNKFCTLISAHKLSSLPNELYSERIRSIRWFEENHPEHFDLYGIGWDKPAFDGILKIIKKIPFYESFVPFRKYPSYRGAVSTKYETLTHYDFAICYENIKGEDGYITEKIFDCFFAGTIPIYWGASNISDHIPANCYIDMSLFESSEKLFSFLIKMSDIEKENCRINIKNFLNSVQSNQFKVDSFAKTLCDEILGK